MNNIVGALKSSLAWRLVGREFEDLSTDRVARQRAFREGKVLSLSEPTQGEIEEIALDVIADLKNEDFEIISKRPGVTP